MAKKSQKRKARGSVRPELAALEKQAKTHETRARDALGNAWRMTSRIADGTKHFADYEDEVRGFILDASDEIMAARTVRNVAHDLVHGFDE